jgi:hypothetical protein
MDILKDASIGIVDSFFPGYTPLQKRNNVRFLHAMTVFLMALLFIFAPARSYVRYGIFGLYCLFIFLYVTLGDCWVYHVEQEYFKTENDAGVLSPLVDLLGLPNEPVVQDVITGVGYSFVALLSVCLLIRDSFGVY